MATKGHHRQWLFCCHGGRTGDIDGDQVLHGSRAWIFGVFLGPTLEAVAPQAQAVLWRVEGLTSFCEAFPLLCPVCGGQMRIIAFITHSADIRHILRTSAQRPSHLAPRQHAGRRFGMRPMRQLVKVWKLKARKPWSPCRTGARAAKRHPTLKPISASVGEGENSELSAAGRQAAPGTAHARESRRISGNWL